MSGLRLRNDLLTDRRFESTALRRLPIGAVQVLLWGTVLLFGWLLGGPVGVDTIVSTFGSGVVMQIIYSLIKFEPRKIEHQSVFDTVRQFKTDARSI